MATNRAKQLEKLTMSLPAANQQAAQGAQQARMVQLQSQIGQLQPGVGGPGLAQQMGAQQAQQAGGIQLAAQKQGQQQMQQAGQQALQQQGREQRQAGFEQQLKLNEQQQNIANRLARIDSRYKNMLLDDQLSFRKDQANQTLLNQRQLADFALLKAKNKEEYAQYAQMSQQIHNRELQLMEAAQAKIDQALRQNYVKKGKPLDRALQKELAEKKRSLDAAIARKKQKAANNALMWNAGGQILGAAAAVGAVALAAPTGGASLGAYAAAAGAGSALGGGFGSLIGSKQ